MDSIPGNRYTPPWFVTIALCLLVLAVFSVGSSKAEEDRSSGSDGSWHIHTAGSNTLLYSRKSGESYILTKDGGGANVVWVEVPRLAASSRDAQTDHPVLVKKVMESLWSEVVEVETDESGTATGLTIQPGYKDQGLGLRPGDTVTSVNETDVRDLKDIWSAFRSEKKDENGLRHYVIKYVRDTQKCTTEIIGE